MARGWLVIPGDADEARASRRLVRCGLVVIAIAFGGVGAWLAMAPVSGAVIAPGIVKVDTNRKVVQHQEGGIVKAILVRDGEHVTAGQAVIELQDVQVEATLELVRTQLDAEWARHARLSAEREMARRVMYPETLVRRRADERVAELIRREDALFEVHLEVLRNNEKLLGRQIEEIEREIEARLVQDEADAAAIRLQREELNAYTALLAQGFVSRMRHLELERAVVAYESRRGTNQAEMARARQRVVDLELRLSNLRSDFTQQAEKELNDSTARIYDLQERLKPFEDAAARQRISAPVDGEVVDLRVTTVGSVIGPRDRLMEIVPVDPDLIVEVHVRPEDITHVAVGSHADVRLTAFKQRITPVVPGTVIYVSADRLSEPTTNTSHYLAHVRVLAEALRHAGGLTLKAGMPAEAYLKTEPRTPLAYLLDPLLAYVNRGLREP
jgi:HlyD family type I secretion membrane fusion protein